jgi:hypothetical protein
MTKREICKMNKQYAEARLHATVEYQEAMKLDEEIWKLVRAGHRNEANRLLREFSRLMQEA